MVRANLLLLIVGARAEGKRCGRGDKRKTKAKDKNGRIERYHVSLNDDDKMHKLTIITY